MKLFIVLSLVVAVALARPDGGHYDSKYDSFDVQELIENPRLLKAYTLCMLGKGSCTAEGANFKKILPEAVETTCGKCTPKQRVLVRKVVKAVQEKLPEEWDELVKKQDPEGKYTESFSKFLLASE